MENYDYHYEKYDYVLPRNKCFAIFKFISVD